MSLFSYLTPIQLVKVNSPINSEIKVVERFGRRTLYVDDAEQSGGTITGMWDKSISNIKNQISKIKTCLVLGLGGGTVINILNKKYPELKIHAIELDSVMIEIAEKYFNIKSSAKLKIINSDVFSWISNNRKKYDLIIMDIYIGKVNPPKARTRTFLMALKNLLSRFGLILFNAHYQNDEQDYQRLLKLCKKVFSDVELVLSYPYSRILLLSK